MTYHERLLRYAFHLTGSRHQAEDVLQTTWLKCLTHEDIFFRIETERERLAWLLVILRNTALDEQEKEKTFLSLKDEIMVTGQEEDRTEEIHAIIRAMPERYREILTLRFIHEYEPVEIARLMHLTLPATYTKLHRARKALQKELRKGGFHRG